MGGAEGEHGAAHLDNRRAIIHIDAHGYTFGPKAREPAASAVGLGRSGEVAGLDGPALGFGHAAGVDPESSEGDEVSEEVHLELGEGENLMQELGEIAPDLPMSAAHGISAMAMTLALKYWDINTIQEGALYQQYKLEGKNPAGLHMDMVIHTAIQIEAHIIAAPTRLTAMFERDLVGAVQEVLKTAFSDEDSGEAEQTQEASE
jgi:hypothetical protein